VGHVGINGEILFVFKYSGLHMETGFCGLSTFVHVDPRNVLFFGFGLLKLKCALLPLILLRMERRVVCCEFHFRSTITSCILTEERVDKIFDLEASPRFLA